MKPNADVLDIGTGNGILAITALERGARSAVATDINAKAVDNARLNAKLRNFDEKLDVRLVTGSDPGAYSVIGDDERFDLIVCNCPSFDADVGSYDEAIAFDPGHALVTSLVNGLGTHLKPGGKLLMTFWSGAGVNFLKKLAAENELELTVLEPKVHQKIMPGSPQSLDRNKLYKIPIEKIKDDFTGRERTLIVEITPRRTN